MASEMARDAIRYHKAVRDAKADVLNQLSASDWQEIYYALEYKKTSPAVAGDQKWIAQLNRIIRLIGPDGQNVA